jgi:hypothetical protein
MARLQFSSVTFGFCCGLCVGGAFAQEDAFPSRMAGVGGIADIAARFTLDLRSEGGGTAGLPMLELSTLHRPPGGIDLLARTTAAGSLAGAMIRSGNGPGDTATVSIVTFSPPDAENATTVHAITQGPGGPILAAATTSSEGPSAGDGASAYAVLTGPEGAVFRATGDLSRMSLRPWTTSYRRERTRKPTYAWNLSEAGRTEVSFFLQSVEGRVSEGAGGGIDIDLAETVSGARLPAISMMQVQTLQARSIGVLAGLGLARQMGGGLSLWTEFGFGSHRLHAETRVLHELSVDQAAANGFGDLWSVSRRVPSAVLSIGLRQAFGEGHSLSVYLAAEANHTPALAFVDDGPATITITARQGVTVGLNMRWQF